MPNWENIKYILSKFYISRGWLKAQRADIEFEIFAAWAYNCVISSHLFYLFFMFDHKRLLPRQTSCSFRFSHNLPPFKIYLPCKKGEKTEWKRWRRAVEKIRRRRWTTFYIRVGNVFKKPFNLYILLLFFIIFLGSSRLDRASEFYCKSMIRID